MAQERRRRAEPSAGFFFNVEKWRGSRAVQRMSFSERGVYLEMMLEQWGARNLPDDVGDVADAIAGSAEQIAEVLNAWPVVRRNFVTSPSNPKRIYNAALERTRRDQAANRRARQVSGAHGGNTAAANRKSRKALLASTPIGVLQESVAKSREENRREEKGIDQKRTEESPAASSRSKRPIFSGQRFVVHEWQLDDLMRMLGSQVEDFDLHEWFFTLDAQVLKSREIIPQRDGGAWLQAQTLAEVSRRGLTIAVATPPTQASKRVAGLIAGGEKFLKSGA